jgi:hypothetical protein
MTLARRFEELEIWKAAQDFAVVIYDHFGPESAAPRLRYLVEPVAVDLRNEAEILSKRIAAFSRSLDR